MFGLQCQGDLASRLIMENAGFILLLVRVMGILTMSPPLSRLAVYLQDLRPTILHYLYLAWRVSGV